MALVQESWFRRRGALLWIIAAVLTLGSAAYQRLTGPTHPVRGELEIGGRIVSYTLLRSHETGEDAEMRFRIPDREVRGEMEWRRQRSTDAWKVVQLAREEDDLLASLPAQPPAGKVAYRMMLIDARGKIFPLTEEPVVIRFKGAVSAGILIPHIALMFTAMILSMRAGLEALVRGERAYRLAAMTAVLFFAGGLVLGPIVQKYAFGAFWTGWPLGHDLTDNKTAAVFMLWLIALWRGRAGRGGRFWIITAAVVQLVVYLVPHSVLGSELDYTKSE
jgi:hypothetical protein